jgi:hypothetical protein
LPARIRAKRRFFRPLGRESPGSGPGGQAALADQSKQREIADDFLEEREAGTPIEMPRAAAALNAASG